MIEEITFMVSMGISAILAMIIVTWINYRRRRIK